MKKILTALFCMTLAAPAVQAQNVVRTPAQSHNAAPQKEVIQQPVRSERRHGTAGMKNNNELKMEKAQGMPVNTKATETGRANTERRATPTR